MCAKTNGGDCARKVDRIIGQTRFSRNERLKYQAGLTRQRTWRRWSYAWLHLWRTVETFFLLSCPDRGACQIQCDSSGTFWEIAFFFFLFVSCTAIRLWVVITVVTGWLFACQSIAWLVNKRTVVIYLRSVRVAIQHSYLSTLSDCIYAPLPQLRACQARD